jgi:phage shock protein E
MGLLNQLFGGPTAGCAEADHQNSVVIDVRTPHEFKMGHVEDSVNIPLDILGNHINDLKQEGRSVILCCATGARSGRASSMLKAHGIQACNGGSWISVRMSKQN